MALSERMSISRLHRLLIPLAFVCASVFGAATTFASDLSVSPPNWWAGMEENTVELMIYGESIASADVSINVADVSIVETKRLDSENYLFVTLNLTKAQPQNLAITISYEDDTTTVLDYEIKEREEGSASRQGFQPKDAIYLIAPDRFANGDTSNDSLEGYADKLNRTYKGGRHGGDIAGIKQNLDYLADLGFTQIWTMPMLENAMDKYSYHGYSTTDYYLIDPRFGTNQEYVDLSEAAADKGIGIIMDMVLNHIGSEHLWMKDMPSHDWIHHNGSFSATSHRREALHDPNGIASDISAFADGWFVPTMPDLNQKHPQLANYLIQNAIWWVEYANLSGIRVDTYSYSDKAFLAEWTSRLMQEYPNFNIVGEEWSVNPAITAYWQAGSPRYDDYQSALPSVMDFPLQVNVTNALLAEETWNTGLTNIYQTLASDFLYGDAGNLVVFPDNHDMSRIFSQLNEDKARWNMAMTFFLTVRGIPQVFYGTEILMKNPGTDDHGIIRTDFPGGWASDTISGFTGVGLSEDALWAQARVRQLLSLRKTMPEVFNGEMKHYAPVNGVYTYVRLPDEGEASEKRIIVVLNKNDTDIDFDMQMYNWVLEGRTTVKRLYDGKTFAIDSPITVSPMSASVFVVD